MTEPMTLHARLTEAIETTREHRVEGSEDIATALLAAPSMQMERRLATDEIHEDDGYGGCVSCRIIDLGGPWDANDDDAVTTTVSFPCAVVRADALAQALNDELVTPNWDSGTTSRAALAVHQAHKS